MLARQFCQGRIGQLNTYHEQPQEHAGDLIGLQPLSSPTRLCPFVTVILHDAASLLIWSCRNRSITALGMQDIARHVGEDLHMSHNKRKAAVTRDTSSRALVRFAIGETLSTTPPLQA